MDFNYAGFFSTWHESEKKYAPRMQELPITSSAPEIPYEDELVHTPENGYRCEDASCPCHEDCYTFYGGLEDDKAGTHPPDCMCPWCI